MTVRPQCPTTISERSPSAFFSVTLQVGHTSTLVLFWLLSVLSTLVPFAQYVSRDLQHSALYPGNKAVRELLEAKSARYNSRTRNLCHT